MVASSVPDFRRKQFSRGFHRKVTTGKKPIVCADSRSEVSKGKSSVALSAKVGSEESAAPAGLRVVGRVAAVVLAVHPEGAVRVAPRVAAFRHRDDQQPLALKRSKQTENYEHNGALE